MDEMVLPGLAALQHPGTALPRMCPLEYAKEMLSTLLCPPHQATPANDGDKNCIDFKGKKKKNPSIGTICLELLHRRCVPGQKVDIGKLSPKKAGFAPVEL